MPNDDKIDLSMFLDDYLNDAREGFQEINSALLALEKDHSQTARLDEIFRVVHTLKSSSIMLEFQDIPKLAHMTEDLLDRMRKNELLTTQETIDVLFEAIDTLEMMVNERGKRNKDQIDFQAVGDKIKKLTIEKSQSGKKDKYTKKSTIIPAIEKIRTVRVDISLLDAQFNLVGELIITKNRIANIISETANKELKAVLSTMDHLIRDLQENVSAARLVQVDEIFQKFPRMVHDLAKEKDKEIEFVLEGSEIELDKAMLDSIGEPIIHLLRNAVDHGIETAQMRQKLNKKKSGTIKLIAKRSENHIIIEVEDDGGGIDTAHLREVFTAKGLIKPEDVEMQQDNDLIDMLFRPGFTGAKEITNISGRGVGLDVVRNSVTGLGGTVEVATQIDKGTRFTLKLPPSTAIMQTLMVNVGNHIFAIPSDIILETLEIKPEDIKEIENARVLMLRKEVIPFVMLHDLLNIPFQEDQNKLVGVIVHKGNKFLALGVDMVQDQVENIIKPFDPIAQQFKGFSGGTILGNGRVALLLDVSTLIDFKTV